MLLCQFVYICTQKVAICFTKGYLSVFSPFSLRICTAQFFFLRLGIPGEGIYLYHAHFSTLHIIN